MPCAGIRNAPAPTNAPAALSALAASLAVLEARKVLEGDWSNAGYRVVFDAREHRVWKTRLTANPSCRFDHAVYDVRDDLSLRVDMPISEVSELVGSGAGGYLALEGQTFVTRVTCLACGATKRLLRLSHRLRPGDLACRKCGHATIWTGFDAFECLDGSSASRAQVRTLASAGFCPGDVVTVGSVHGARHYRLGPPQRPVPKRESVGAQP